MADWFSLLRVGRCLPKELTACRTKGLQPKGAVKEGALHGIYFFALGFVDVDACTGLQTYEQNRVCFYDCVFYLAV